MEVKIKAIHFDATEKLQAFIAKKVEKLEKSCEEIRKVEVSLKVVKPETAMNKEAGLKSQLRMRSFLPTRFATHLRKQ